MFPRPPATSSEGASARLLRGTPRPACASDPDLAFHGFVWGDDSIAENAQRNLGVQFEVLDRRSLDYRGFI
jgi:hypothetical protein